MLATPDLRKLRRDEIGNLVDTRLPIPSLSSEPLQPMNQQKYTWHFRGWF
jgi:hypothetical protein